MQATFRRVSAVLLALVVGGTALLVGATPAGAHSADLGTELWDIDYRIEMRPGCAADTQTMRVYYKVTYKPEPVSEVGFHSIQLSFKSSSGFLNTTSPGSPAADVGRTATFIDFCHYNYQTERFDVGGGVGGWMHHGGPGPSPLPVWGNDGAGPYRTDRGGVGSSLADVPEPLAYGEGPPPLTYDQAEPLGKCSRVLEPLDGVWYANFTMTVDNRPPAGPYFPGGGPFAEDYVSLDLPWTPPTFDDDLYTWRSKLPPVAEQPAGGWLPRFHLRRRLLEYHGFTRPGAHEADYMVATGDAPYKGSEEVTLTCALVVDVTDPDKGAEAPLGEFAPDEEQSPENMTNAFRKCIPPGLGVLNPKKFVIALGCVLEVAFVPRAPSAVDQVVAEAKATIVGDATTTANVLTSTYGVLREGANNVPASCDGPAYSIPYGGGHSADHKPFSTCFEGSAKMAGTMRLLGLVGLYIAFGLAVFRLLSAGMGLAWGPMNRTEVAEAEATK